MSPESRLAIARVAANDTAPNDVVLMHGIYGRGRNWQGIARALTAARPEYACWLVDLPHHGDSPAGAHGDTIAGLAEDVEAGLAARGIRPAAILGHSSGGKIALRDGRSSPREQLQLWIIDSTPGGEITVGRRGWTMLELIHRLPPRFATRDEAITSLVEGGYTLGVAQWMATNLARDNDGFVWRLDFDAMQRLLENFFTTDMWAVIEQPSASHDIHILKAAESSAISPAAVSRIERAVGSQVHLHHRAGGHWIHAETPEVVTALLVEYLPHTIT